MSEQVAGLRRLADAMREEIRGAMRERARRSGLRLLAVTSGKGGVGKTNLAVNLALAFLELGQPVLLVDADLGLANTDLLLGAEPRYHLGHVLRGQARLAEAVYRGPEGLRLLSGGVALEDLAGLPPEQILSFISQLPDLAGRGDLVLLDTGAGLGGHVRAFLAAAPEVLVVTTPEPTALADAYASIKVLSREHPESTVYLVVNQADNPREAREAAHTLSRVARRYLGMNVQELGYIPRDPAVPRSVREKRPFLLAAPNAPASVAVRQVAARLNGEAFNGFREPGWGGFVSRFLKGILGAPSDERVAAEEEPTD